MTERQEAKEIKNGTIIEALPDTRFRAKLDGGQVVLVYLGGKMRHFRIRVLVGDQVKVELNPYDSTRGRIVQRL